MQPLIRTEDNPPWPARLLAGAELLGWALAGVVLARALWLAITPVGALGEPQVAAPPRVMAAIDPFFPQAAAPADAVSGLDLALVGTRVDAASGRGSAIIATPDGRQQSIGVGEEIMPGVRLAAVDFESVTLDRGGVRETLYIDQSGPPAAAGAPQ
ncbi:type II secretion system protein N [Sandarakinorhabdus rubra]|uniref:type II secretion system protein N n=1 Tax=Sandarakinorhabdus rubra TaxID=2672568 RepID=UPI0013DD6FB3|nr:type II secretion system protein N [Sandarakinorhabdus rubra]